MRKRSNTGGKVADVVAYLQTKLITSSDGSTNVLSYTLW